MSVYQHTLEEAEHAWHIARLEKSLERWRSGDLVRLFPEEYEHHCAVLDALKSGEPYAIRRVEPMAALINSDEFHNTQLGQLWEGVASGFAYTSRASGAYGFNLDEMGGKPRSTKHSWKPLPVTSLNRAVAMWLRECLLDEEPKR